MELILIIISMAVWGIIYVCFGRCGLKRKRSIFLLVYTLLSLLMFADTMYYNYYNQTVSVRQLWQAKSVTAVPDSFIATLIPASFLLFIDIPFVYYSFKSYSEKYNDIKLIFNKKIRYSIYGLTLFLIMMLINPSQSLAVARVKNTEFFTNHVGDICEIIADNFTKGKMDEEEILEVLDDNNNGVESPKYNGIGQEMNLIVIQLEAMQDFVINSLYNGQEITPNLNKLIAKDSLYFDNYYSNTGKGNTADAEFTSLNSLYPLIDGEIYRLYEITL